MRKSNSRMFWGALVMFAFGQWVAAPARSQEHPLPSWNDGAAKQAIVRFVERVTKEDTADFVPPAERIATFDNDGTLWGEQPAYFQALFAIDRVKALAPQHPEWKDKEPFKSAIAGDLKGVAGQGMKGLGQIVAVSHAGLTAEEFNAVAKDWLATAKHPQTGRLYKDMVYQPMLELLAYLRANGFKTFIVSGGGIEFLRAFAEETYGIPPEQIIGSSIKAKFEMRDGVPVLVKLAELNFLDDKEGKPVAINEYIGRRPIFAAGNSDGDLQMLQYTTIPRGPNDRRPRLGLLIHHTDAEREWAYDRDSHFGKLDKAISEAPGRGWLVVDMKKGWRQVYPQAR
jgi:phosphoserine phosphatase